MPSSTWGSLLSAPLYLSICSSILSYPSPFSFAWIALTHFELKPPFRYSFLKEFLPDLPSVCLRHLPWALKALCASLTTVLLLLWCNYLPPHLHILGDQRPYPPPPPRASLRWSLGPRCHYHHHLHLLLLLLIQQMDTELRASHIERSSCHILPTRKKRFRDPVIHPRGQLGMIWTQLVQL